MTGMTTEITRELSRSSSEDSFFDKENEHTNTADEKVDEFGDVISVGDLTFLDVSLGSGPLSIVRLARREKKPYSEPHIGGDMPQDIEPENKGHEPSPSTEAHTTHGLIGEFGQRIAHSAMSFLTDDTTTKPASNRKKSDDDLVAVKIYNKSILKRMRTIKREAGSRKIKVSTALEKVEREIALMKMIRHPNIVPLLDVIDSEESDSLYLVIEYMPRGEIMSFDEETARFRRVPREGMEPLKGVNADGYFDEKRAALYFVDVLHGLAYLHRNGICHRDLKPENILLDAKGQVKIADFGVSHFFESEADRPGPSRLEDSIEIHQIYDKPLKSKIIRGDTDSALDMKGMSNLGMLTKTEGTWCFWSPEMCSQGKESAPFSGYAADVWSAGICLYIFTTGNLPFYSDVPTELFEMIADADVNYTNGMSDNLISLLKMLLEKDPDKRAGLGDCLKHAFCKEAKERRVKDYSAEFSRSNRRLVVKDDDLRKSFVKVKQVVKVCSKKLKHSKIIKCIDSAVRPYPNKKDKELPDPSKEGCVKSSQQENYLLCGWDGCTQWC
mmetsp:Transcript_17483/g.25696  ORF Transcript_17483/g.25696 Transcript_17483/m.25696 type:complete len:555 (+) Transcript_17483:85-1749(+)